MKYFKSIIVIIIVFFQTGNVLSDNNIFHVNNIEIEERNNASSGELANKAIKKGFNQLIERILLKEDIIKLSNLNLGEIKELILYYQILKKENLNNQNSKSYYNLFFDREKMYDLFFKKNISYSDIVNKEIYLLPILKKKNQIYIYNQNFFYDMWNEISDNQLVEFILPLENIEIIENVNLNKNNLLNLELSKLLLEYSDRNLALVLIEDSDSKQEKIFLKLRILGKKINKNIIVKKDQSEKEFYEKIIKDVKDEITNIIKSQNLIDIRTPSFLNAKLIEKSNNNLVELKKRVKNIDLIEDIYVQEFNKNDVFLKIKYFGKINKIINQLNKEKIILKLSGDEWSIKIL